MGCGSSSPTILPNNQSHTRIRHTARNTNNNRKPIEINEEALNEYLQLESSINDYEKKHVLENYQIKSEQLEQLDEAVKQLEKDKKLFQQQTNEIQNQMGIIDLHSVRDYILQKTLSDTALSQEEEKLVDSLNRFEVVEKELETTTQQQNNMKLEVQQSVIEGEKLQHLYQKRDELLDAIFEGQYASDTENQLEKELDWLLEQKHHVDQAHFRWKQANTLVKQSNAQLGRALQKWKQLLEIPVQDNEQRYNCVAETRDNLVSATQNLIGAQRYLPNISLPYCAPDEIDTINKAISYIFTDMQTSDRHKHALNCYQTTYKRAGALRQWLEQVLNSTIAKDLQELTEECKARASELRTERIRLIRNRIKEMTGNEVNFDEEAPFEFRDSGVDSELDETAAADEQIAQIFEKGNNERKGGAKSLTPDPTRMPLIMPTPLPTADLAPMPSDNEIFGKIEQIRNQHKRATQEFQKTQRLNQARMSHGLKQKLHQRKSRRSRMELHRRELEALRESPVN
ncbi:uncharacterized protein LOC128960213 [Oppia nitens]|uniref:uncharacterized protein LOC128960213 n=1 Tax=Oppia nitens TaxID=1686743 RepID=UPI0023D9C512|nr:uncharacterized protein LOC128960213 [Oppia nitens]